MGGEWIERIDGWMGRDRKIYTQSSSPIFPGNGGIRLRETEEYAIELLLRDTNTSIFHCKYDVGTYVYKIIVLMDKEIDREGDQMIGIDSIDGRRNEKRRKERRGGERNQRHSITIT